MASNEEFTVLHIGDDIKYNPDLYESFSTKFKIVQPAHEERQRDAFIQGLKEKRWGNFHAVFRPFWNSGGEMGRWDQGNITAKLALLSTLRNHRTCSTSARNMQDIRLCWCWLRLG